MTIIEHWIECHKCPAKAPLPYVGKDKSRVDITKIDGWTIDRGVITCPACSSSGDGRQ